MDDTLDKLATNCQDEKFKKDIIRKLDKYPPTNASRISLHVCCVLVVALICATVVYSEKISFNYKIEELKAELGQVKVYIKPKPRRKWKKKR